jgi:tol-pal system protein YbgF
VARLEQTQVTKVNASKLLGSLVLPLLLGACVSSSDIDELHTQLSDIQRQVLVLQKQTSSKQEVGDLQQQISAHTESLLKSEADVQVAVQNLSMQIDQLEANLEDTNYRLSQLSQQIAATNQELKSVRTTLGATGGPAETSQPPMTPPSDPQSLYQTAYNDYLRGNYDLAVLGFRQYLETFPDTELADNAAYWIGESFFSQAKYQQAIREFDSILRRYPRSDKLASALLKKGYAYLELGESEQGILQLQHVIREYPRTDEANLARQRLAALGVDSG